MDTKKSNFLIILLMNVKNLLEHTQGLYTKGIREYGSISNRNDRTELFNGRNEQHGTLPPLSLFSFINQGNTSLCNNHIKIHLNLFFLQKMNKRALYGFTHSSDFGAGSCFTALKQAILT
jgi:hypothetical protein